MRNIFLCGFMGCGKSHISELLSEKTGCKAVDLDEYIEKKEGRTIPEIFAADGEAYFRALEEKYIREMPEGSVVATGGGAVINPITAESARKSGTVIFLDADFELCYSRIKDDPHRPLAANSTKQQLKELFDRRKGIYLKNSEFTVDANGIDTDIVDEIIEKAGLK